ncbi:hypothetical protein HELRODRAFT_65481 [Helobdella robusta]|uniref:Choline/ethanolamine kinase n=1 Tax=Helobdella robusta TaxID=6412 RepID=T1FY83_HELRO|nr:hypothetical protein HELRODRAFT_65481 [Helobdella robusta]ESO02337.1 hypothetical protein HELRODRAFT_65481 [Helobdella robusta]
MAGKQITDEFLRKEGFEYCQDYLGGSWFSASIEDFIMEHITGGLSNILYKCSLADHVPMSRSEVRTVLVRFYGEIITDNSDVVLIDSVVYTLLAERKMGPKLYGVFTKGRIEEFVPARVLKTCELHDPTISRACARIMSRFHRLRMPMVKKPKWLFDTIERYLKGVIKLKSLTSSSSSSLSSLSSSSSLNSLPSTLDGGAVDKLKNLLKKVNSPVVFCHNDLQEAGNILYSGDKSNVDSSVKDHFTDIVRPIDFEYSSYNYRGFDIGNHFCEWCYNYNVNEYPYYAARLDQFPNKEQQLNFIREYLKEKRSFYEDDEDGLVLEACSFALASHFMWCLWSIVQWKKSKIIFGYMDYAIDRINAYLHQKPLILKQIDEYNMKKRNRK